MMNLHDNALRYMPSGGAVTVRLQAVAEGVAEFSPIGRVRTIQTPMIGLACAMPFC
ncbi:MAG: hypothetical protein ABI604_17930 [Nitrospirota bacterium]